MSLLRIYCSLRDPPLQCQWALIDSRRKLAVGEGPLTQLPQRYERVQIVIPAAQVLIARTKLPASARHRTDSLLAFAIEEETAGEPDTHRVCWLGTAGEHDVLAVVDRNPLQRWLAALEGSGIASYEVHCETLLLPRVSGEWSIAWNGTEGFVRSGELEGAATDCGDRVTPPLALRLMLAEAETRGSRPRSLALYVSAPEAMPDLDAWQRELGVTLHVVGPWDWRVAPADAGVSLIRQRRRWQLPAGSLLRLRPAAWIAGLALAIHAVALVADWTVLASERGTLRQQMETRFRAVFPDAVAVVDPALQMRRNLAQARRAAGRPDSGDFLPMIEPVAAVLRDLPAGSLRTLSYESGRLTVQLAPSDPAVVERLVARLRQTGLGVDAAAAPRDAGIGAMIITLRAL